ncbi:tRNA uridine-5-carboxymethylaminomethyl(34) synthesis GTPase MnmE [Seleniivibrio sp.]|uniref:tRNA uridine-5-carboxymethylaminomethyl(34) synthesis GTPase MnmE n=1 Tax=Seleniivibrio sp. TaxID=2898801 RepID=UPI0025D25F6A|nr:tRNA uridine-5-carboxymethylaminomethyl(34) synthesis GTPase MnmE [Seleniivibrio sp.]MCD8553889.1 tRNA uridine-5-carboxymethylaminomethyl(34) synthesis GTPase MnmE [Seleniivibrio sp.]
MDTIYAAISPLISSAIIVVRISGDKAVEVFELLNGADVKNIQPRNVYNLKYSGSVSDDVLAVYFKAPNSYTGEDVVEISFHGNPIIVSSAFKDFEKLGFVTAEPGEFTKRAFLNGKMDLTQAESVAELISSKTLQGIDYSYEQLKGSLRKEIEYIKDLFINALTIIEAHIDFPEEDIEDAHARIVFENLELLKAELSAILASYDSHRIMRDGYRIAIAGKPNTGKSSLMNFLLKEERAIVSDVAGTTRDYIESNFVLNGVPVSLVDTAGLRITSDAVEKAGIERTGEVIKDADLVLVLLDGSTPLDEEDKNVLESTKELKRLVVVNKSDRPLLLNDIKYDCLVSVKDGSGMSELLKKCGEVVSITDADRFGKAVMVTARQRGYFIKILETVEKLSDESEIDFDIFEYELNSSLRLLSEITGLSYTEDILTNIFNNFCIGK